MEKLTSVNIMKICRVCLNPSETMFSIFSELFEDDLSLNMNAPCIFEILTNISRMEVNVNDGLPSMICNSCLDIAHTTFKFQKQCNESQVILEEYTKHCLSLLKTEEIVDINITHTLHELNKEHIITQSKDDNSNEDENDKTSLLLNLPELDKKSDRFGSLTNVSKKILRTKPGGGCQKTYVCNKCGKKYKYPNGLRVHMLNHTEKSPLKCKVCSKCFEQRGSLVHHMRSHTGEQPYVCKICGKRYKQSGTLTAHIRVHTGQRPFLCSICGRGFRQAPDLGYHMRTHTKEKPYMCNICGKTMTMQSHLVQHMRIHTGERPFKCSVCNKAFPSSTRLKRHEIIHTGLKPYSCDVCSKSFNRMSSLRVHSKIHTDDRSHVCPICCKGFIQPHALRSHLLSHSSQLTLKT